MSGRMTWLDASGYLVDLDGTLISGRHAQPWGAALLHAVRDRFVIVSNDAEHTPEQLSRFLRSRGLKVWHEQIVVAGTAALDVVAREQPGARVLLLAGVALRTYARRLGLRLTDTGADIVVLSRDRRFSYVKLAAAVNAIRLGATLVATNPDRTHPGPEGSIVPETGALLAALLACVGPIVYRIIGKPEPALFEAGLARLGTPPHDTVVIGDNDETDGLGARRLGMRFAKLEVGDGQATTARLMPLFGSGPRAVPQIGD
jgi:HAD superfamily hydrolase (TIGR01450 family)